ncbi:hypothetical protein MOQ_006972 [Trypanosoma cruzi marinkellei]|uniref:Uncharacterized protein n=1 Tax=Trypanosoma cruzi marinkellei TaxID=85056 RepID=K2MU65_TRYCR|nr:hypothetical protein MOQ_006972 [Trypanosoma cruzi marinkellei]
MAPAPAHTHAAPASLPFVSALCRSGHTHTGSSKITSSSTVQNQHRYPSPRKDLSCQHGPPVALPSTLKHGTVHALIFLVVSQPFASHILRRAEVHKSTPQRATAIAQALAMGACVCAWIRCSHVLAGSLQPVPSCQFIGFCTEKRKWLIPDALIPTSSTNTLVASRHSSAHPGMLKSDVELSANNATIPAHMSAPPEKTHKSQTTPFTCLTGIIPIHRDTPNRSIRHANAPPHTITQSMHHARQQLTRGQTICASHQCYPRAAAGSEQK